MLIFSRISFTFLFIHSGELLLSNLYSICSGTVQARVSPFDFSVVRVCLCNVKPCNFIFQYAHLCNLHETNCLSCYAVMIYLDVSLVNMLVMHASYI